MHRSDQPPPVHQHHDRSRDSGWHLDAGAGPRNERSADRCGDGGLRSQQPPLHRAVAVAGPTLSESRCKPDGCEHRGGRLGAFRSSAPPRAHPHPSTLARPTPPWSRWSCAGASQSVPSCQAIETVLTRPATHGELRDAGRSMALAANADHTRADGCAGRTQREPRPARAAAAGHTLADRRPGYALPRPGLSPAQRHAEPCPRPAPAP